MRTEPERTEFCATIMSAARKCQIGIGKSSSVAGFRYVWRDNMTEGLIKGSASEDRKIALELACEALVDYFNPKSA